MYAIIYKTILFIYFLQIGEEANAARNNVAVFDLSYFTKMYLTGPDAEKAADWLFTADTDKEPGRVVYTCALNKKGGVEADVTVTALEEGVGTLVGPILKVLIQQLKKKNTKIQNC